MASRVGNTTNLSNNDRYDLLTFDFPEGFPNSKLTFTTGSIPRKITGVQKVAQVFLKCLMTTKGSDLIDSNAGTTLPEYLRSSNVVINDSGEFRSILTSSVEDAASQAKYILNVKGASTESQLDTAEVRGVQALREGYSIIIKLLTRSGVDANIAVPFNSTGLTINE